MIYIKSIFTVFAATIMILLFELGRSNSGTSFDPNHLIEISNIYFSAEVVLTTVSVWVFRIQVPRNHPILYAVFPVLIIFGFNLLSHEKQMTASYLMWVYIGIAFAALNYIWWTILQLHRTGSKV